MINKQPTNLPSASEKPSLLDWLETFLPFRLPRIPLVQTAKNLDRAAAGIVSAGGDYAISKIQAHTIRTEARSAAEKSLIEFGERQISQTPSMVERALEYAVGDAIAKQTNREEILRLTSEDLASDPPKIDTDLSIDDDWLNSFKQYAETKSNADIQQLWAKILSSEIRSPGTTSLRTLAFLSTASSAEAKRIVNAFSFVIDEQVIPVSVQENELLQFSEFLFLEEIGVITGAHASGTTTYSKKAHFNDRARKSAIRLQYFDRMAVLTTSDADFQIHIEVTPLTVVGRELFRLTDTKVANYSYFEDFLKRFLAPPIETATLANVQKGPDGNFAVSESKQLYPAPG